MRIRITNAFLVPFGYQAQAEFFVHINQLFLKTILKVEETLVSLFYKGGNWDTERPPNFPKATQLGSGGVRI